MKPLLVAVTAAGALVLAVGSALAVPGDLDTTFSRDGKVLTNFTAANDGIGDVAIQADGKIVVAGGAISGRFSRFALARYRTNGTLDDTFGGDGKVTTNFTNKIDHASAIAIQADGKIVAAGGAGVGRFALARYNADGSLDTSFSEDGKVMSRFSRRDDGARDVVIQPDGKIAAAGIAGVGRFALVRYDADGTLDTTFGGDGKVTTRFTSGYDIGSGVALQPDDKIVVVGTAGLGAVERGQIAVARYDADGALDGTFDGDGKVITSLTDGDDLGSGLALQEDGKIVAVGRAGFCCEWTGSFGLVRYDADGTLDATFGGDGIVITNFTSGDDSASRVALQPDGKIVAAGDAGYSGLGARFALARYAPGGALDTTFGGDGKVTTEFGSGFDSARGVAIQANGKIVAAGVAYFFGEADGRFALARYLG